MFGLRVPVVQKNFRPKSGISIVYSTRLRGRKCWEEAVWASGAGGGAVASKCGIALLRNCLGYSVQDEDFRA